MFTKHIYKIIYKIIFYNGVIMHIKPFIHISLLDKCARFHLLLDITGSPAKLMLPRTREGNNSPASPAYDAVYPTFRHCHPTTSFFFANWSHHQVVVFTSNSFISFIFSFFEMRNTCPSPGGKSQLNFHFVMLLIVFYMFDL